VLIPDHEPSWKLGSSLERRRRASDIAKGKQVQWQGDVADYHRLSFRIGINIDHIIIEEGDIYGNDVNIAVRVEQLSDPGDTCVSGYVYGQSQEAKGRI
jgi:class 3 adenylate cyclase